MSDVGSRTFTAAPQMQGNRASTLSSPLTTRQRPKGYAALAVALIVGLGALGYFFYNSAGHKSPVVMAAVDIPMGHRITRADLTTVNVAGAVTAVGGEHLTSLIGQQAAVEILPHTLVQRAMVTTAVAVPAGHALVGVAVVPGQLPSSGLRPGDKVAVLALPQKGLAASPKPTAGSNGSVSAQAITSGAVYDERSNPSVSGGVLVTLLVPDSSSLAIATASNGGLIALVKVR